MDQVATHERTWTLERTIGALQVGALSARVDAFHPELGLQNLQLNGRNAAARLLSIHRDEEDAAECTWPLSLAEAYVRGNDLVASYQPSDDWPYAPQIYWSAKAF